jgi:hypothetical protein
MGRPQLEGETVDRETPPGLHFSGPDRPGALLREDDERRDDWRSAVQRLEEGAGI